MVVTKAQIGEALQAAHAAGDEESARRLAAAYQAAPEDPGQPTPIRPLVDEQGRAHMMTPEELHAGDERTSGALRSIVQGGVSGVVGGLAGLGGLGLGLFTAKGPMATANDAINYNSDLVNRGFDAVLGAPNANQQAGAEQAAVPLQLIAKGADYAGEKAADFTGSPLVGAAVNTTLQAAPSLIAEGVRAVRPPAPIPSPVMTRLARNPSQEARTAEAGLQNGMVLPANTLVGGEPIGSPIQRIAAKYAGSENVANDASLENQTAVQALSKQAAKSSAHEPLNTTTIDDALQAAHEPYKALTAVNEPVMLNDAQYLADLNKLAPKQTNLLALKSEPKVLDALADLRPKMIDGKPVVSDTIESTVNKVRELRNDSIKNYRLNTPEASRLAEAQRGAAEALDNLLGRTIDRAAGDAAQRAQTIQQWLDQHPHSLTFEEQVQLQHQAMSELSRARDLAGKVTDYKAARVLISKIKTIQDAMNEGSGNVSAPGIKRQSKGQLTDELKIIAQMNAAFPKATRSVERIVPDAGDVTDKAVRGITIGGIVTAKPGIIARALAAATLRSAARRAAMVRYTAPTAPLHIAAPAIGAVQAGAGNAP